MNKSVVSLIALVCPMFACGDAIPVGQWSQPEAVTQLCPAGFQDEDRSVNTPCTPCTAGSFCGGGAGPAVVCAAGFQDDDGDPLTECSRCPARTFCAGGTAAPVACPAGTADRDGSAATPCEPCVPGEFCAAETISPVFCGPGSIDLDKDPATPCERCRVGEFCEGGIQPRFTCPAGSFDDDKDPATVCRVCEPGSFCGGGGAARVKCGAGYVDHDLNPATDCSECGAGEYCAGGIAQPLVCPEGTSDHDLDAGTVCAACIAGSSCPGGTMAQALCPAGTRDHDSNAASPCISCEVGEFCDEGVVAPQLCSTSFGVDNDSDPSTPCVRRIANVFKWGDAEVGPLNDVPWDNGDRMEVSIDRLGNTYMAATTAGNIDAAGVSFNSDVGTLIIKLDPTGVVEWITHIGGSAQVVTERLVVSAKSEVYVAGHIESQSSSAEVQTYSFPGGFAKDCEINNCALSQGGGGGGAFVVALDGDTGDLRWSQKFGVNAFTGIYGLDVDANGDVVAAARLRQGAGGVTVGDSSFAPLGLSDGYVVRLSRHDGRVQDAFQLNDDPGSNQAVTGLAVLSDGDYALSGFMLAESAILGARLSHQGQRDAYVARVSPSGNPRFVQAISSTPNDEVIWDIHASADNGFYFAGDFEEATRVGFSYFQVNFGHRGAFIAKMTAQGALPWANGTIGVGHDDSDGRPALRRFNLKHRGVDEVLMVLASLPYSDRFAGMTMPLPGLGVAPRNQRLIRIEGKNGAGQATHIDSFNSSGSGFTHLAAVASHPAQDRSCVIGFASSEQPNSVTTIDAWPIPAAGTADQFVMCLNR